MHLEIIAIALVALLSPLLSFFYTFPSTLSFIGECRLLFCFFFLERRESWLFFWVIKRNYCDASYRKYICRIPPHDPLLHTSMSFFVFILHLVFYRKWTKVPQTTVGSGDLARRLSADRSHLILSSASSCLVSALYYRRGGRKSVYRPTSEQHSRIQVMCLE